MMDKEDVCRPAYALKGFMHAPSVNEAVNMAIAEIKELRKAKEVLEVRIMALLMETSK